MAETIVPVAGNVTGDITACKIETVKKSVDRKGAFSLTQTENFVTYDVCTKQVVSEYSANTITGGGFIMIASIMIVLVSIFIVKSTEY